MTSETMKVPYGELVRLSGEALRMLGFKLGHADDASHGMVWTEAVLKRGYSLLRQADLVRIARGWGPTRVMQDNPVTRLDMAGAPLLLYAARVADLAIAALSERKTVQIRAYDTFGGWMVPFIVDRIVGAGFSAAALWRLNPTDRFESPDMLVCGASDVEGVHIFSTTETGQKAQIADGEKAEPQDVALFNPESWRTESADLIIAATSEPIKSNPAALGAALSWAIGLQFHLQTLFPQKEIQSSIMSSFDVAKEDHAFLGSVTRRRWLPASERSRTQAG